MNSGKILQYSFYVINAIPSSFSKSTNSEYFLSASSSGNIFLLVITCLGQQPEINCQSAFFKVLKLPRQLRNSSVNGALHD